MKKIMILSLLIILLIIPFVYALTALNVSWTLPSDTFRPGSDATITLVFTNTGTTDLTNVVATTSGSTYVSVLRGKSELGGLKASTSEQGTVTIKIKDDAPSTTSYVYLEVDYYTGAGSSTKTFNIPITIRRDPVFEIENVKFDSDLTPGRTIELTFDLYNSGIGPAKDVKLILDDDTGIFTATGSTGEITVSELLGKSRKEISYTITIDPDADIGIANIPIDLEYYDETNSEKYEETKNIGVKIEGNIDLVATIDSTENFYRGSIGKLVISIANRGTAPAEYTTVYATSKYGESEFYVGSIDPDDYETIELKQNLGGFVRDYPIDLNITFKDKFNNEYSVQKTINASAASNPGNVTTIVIILIIAGAAYWFYKKKYKKKIDIMQHIPFFKKHK